MTNKNKSEYRIRFSDSSVSLQTSTSTSSDKRPCPVCGFPIGVVAGSKDEICTNCGFKDPCC